MSADTSDGDTGTNKQAAPVGPPAPPPPHVDLVLVFRSTLANSNTNANTSQRTSKDALREQVAAAEAEYTRLLETLRTGGLRATGRRGLRAGETIVCIAAPAQRISELARLERYNDFLRGLPSTELFQRPSKRNTSTADELAPADRLRVVYEFVTSARGEGGLGVVPGSATWPRVADVAALHDHSFNEHWIHAWTRRQIGFGVADGELDKIKDQFGEAVALYFAFLSTYTKALMYAAALGAGFYVLRMPFSPIYSIALVLWSICFVEYWRIRERALSVRWGTRGSFRVERKRAQYEAAESAKGGAGAAGAAESYPWWKRDARILATLPVIATFALGLTAILTGIFVFEAFVTQLYSGPGQKLITFSPTILFIALVPRFLALYHKYAVRMTEWEHHAHQSSYDASLALKTFALSALVAYLGLALSAFVYVPFGSTVMARVAAALFAGSTAVGTHAARAQDIINATTGTGAASSAAATAASEAAQKATGGLGERLARVWARDAKTDPARLQNQMFAFTVTNQVIQSFTEVGLPFVTRKIDAMRSGSGSGGTTQGTAGGGEKPYSSASTSPTSTTTSSPTRKNGKRVVFADEDAGAKEERTFLEGIRHEVALPPYELFPDYSEMATQFGYVALWSAIWPLAPVMALLNNWLELRGDALKITTHARRAIPFRTDTIGPWLEILNFIAWLAALTNTALVYLFQPAISIPIGSDPSPDPSSIPEAGGTVLATHTHTPFATQTPSALLMRAALLALGAAHVHALARVGVRHVLERACWVGGEAARSQERAERRVKARVLRGLGAGRLGGLGEALDGLAVGEEDVDEDVDEGGEGEGEVVLQGARVEPVVGEEEDSVGFWTRDEGLEELRRDVKDA